MYLWYTFKYRIEYSIDMSKSILSMVKTIKLSEETHAGLNSVGYRGESFDI